MNDNGETRGGGAGDSSNGTTRQDEQLEEILNLMQSRAAGMATNEQLERAVTRMLGPAPPPVGSAADHAVAKNVQVDTDDYDEGEEEDDKAFGSERENSSVKVRAEIDVTDSTQLAFSANVKSNKGSNKIDWDELYGDIPLGQQGARMMLTFGDGSPPLPETVRATLRGACRMTQVAIQDARHLRRQRRKVFCEAQAVLKADTQRAKRPRTGHKDAGSGRASDTPSFHPINQWSPDLLYRVHTGYDSLAYKLKCGFDAEDLQHLFPEEINAYTRWNSSYHAYTDKAEASDEVGPDEQGSQEDDSRSGEGLSSENAKDTVGGHLQERAAQFDVRTDQMKKERYIEFAELRKGSFLPRRMTALEEQAMDNNTGWGNLPPIAVRFLHWVGFDPGSALPPPNLATTQALAFLAYDFFGRIVEKAIELRQTRNRMVTVNDDEAVLELQPGEQLMVKDIEQAMDHPDIRPTPLHQSSSDDKEPAGTQLYFGPGFEYRLEMELEELISAGSRDKKKRSNTDQDDAERAKQEEDEELFQRLAKDRED